MQGWVASSTGHSQFFNVACNGCGSRETASVVKLSLSLSRGESLFNTTMYYKHTNVTQLRSFFVQTNELASYHVHGSLPAHISQAWQSFTRQQERCIPSFGFPFRPTICTNTGGWGELSQGVYRRRGCVGQHSTLRRRHRGLLARLHLGRCRSSCESTPASRDCLG